MKKIKRMAILMLPTVMFMCHGMAEATLKSAVSNFYSRNSPDTLIRLYEDPGRQEWQKPMQVVDLLSVKPGDAVADIGAGTGYFSVLFAKKTGDSGMVYAVDIDRNMVEYVKQRAEREGLSNLRAILAKADDPMLAEDSTDLVFICNTYMFIEDRESYLARLKDAIKKNGRLVIISYNLIDSPEGPPIHTRISKKITVSEVEKAGFVLEKEHFILPYQHFLIFTRRD
ncbi:MAG: methyltransferase domain-containing protein [Geobacter sp.]|nr:methyltransferase domain-containing protein [Geobacter sp.]